MDEVKIVGIRSTEFTGNDGKKVSGTSLYFEMSNPHVTGVETGKLFIGEALAKKLTYCPGVGDLVQIFYNRFGKVADIRRVPGNKA